MVKLVWAQFQKDVRVTYWKPSPGDEISGEIDGFFEVQNGRMTRLNSSGGRVVIKPSVVIENALRQANAKRGDILRLKYIGERSQIGSWPYKLYAVQVWGADGNVYFNGTHETIPDHWFESPLSDNDEE